MAEVAFALSARRYLAERMPPARTMLEPRSYLRLRKSSDSVADRRPQRTERPLLWKPPVTSDYGIADRRQLNFFAVESVRSINDLGREALFALAATRDCRNSRAGEMLTAIDWFLLRCLRFRAAYFFAGSEFVRKTCTPITNREARASHKGSYVKRDSIPHRHVQVPPRRTAGPPVTGPRQA